MSGLDVSSTSGPGLVLHTAGPSDAPALSGVLRSAANARRELASGTPIEVVVQGPTVQLLVAESVAQDALLHAQRDEISVVACRNSMRSADVHPDRLLPGVSVTPAAVAHLTHRQWAGWAYVRL